MYQLWRQTPIVPYLIALIGGIIIADACPYSFPLWMYAGFAAICAGALFTLRNGSVLLIVSGLAAFLCGFMLVELHRSTGTLPQDKQLRFAEIVSIGRESEKSKNAVIVLYERIGDTAFQVGEHEIAGIFIKKFQNTDSLTVGQIISFDSELIPLIPDNSFTVSQLRKGICYRTFISSYRVCGTRHPKFWEIAQRWLRKNILCPQNMHQHLLVKGIVLGDKIGFTKETLRPYQQAGFMQHLSVSGMHIGIIATLLSFMFSAVRKTQFSKILGSLVSVIIVWFYVAIADFTPAAVRAAIMFSIYFLVEISENHPNKYNILASTALGMLVLSPMLVFDIGFQLSFAAMVGLIASLRLNEAYITISNPILKYLVEGIIIGIGAQLCTLPFCLFYFGYYPTYSLIFGFAAGIIVFGIMALVLVAIIAFFAEMANWVGIVIDFLADMLEFLAEFSNGLPLSSLSLKLGSWTSFMFAVIVLALVLWVEILLHKRAESQFV